MTEAPGESTPEARSVMGEPTADGRFGEFGGRFVPETLVAACEELEAAFREAWADPAFVAEFEATLCDYGGRPSPLTECRNLSRQLGVRLLVKREDLNHTGSHKINNVIGQALLAQRMGKTRLVAETGAGQHGVATATAAALLGMECKVYMGAVDVERQALNVFRMQLLGSEVEAVQSGSRTLKDAVNEALRDWVATVEHTHYCLGSVMGPHPYPWMVRTFHHILGDEAAAQCKDLTGRDPDVVVACVGGGSNAAGIFSGFADGDARARRRGAFGRRRGGAGRARRGAWHDQLPHAGRSGPGDGKPSRSRPGWTIPGVGPEHAYLAAIGRAEYPSVTDDEVVEAFTLMSRAEGIIPALECAHALAWIVREAPHMAGQTVLMNLSGRGDKDVDQMMDVLGIARADLMSGYADSCVFQPGASSLAAVLSLHP